MALKGNTAQERIWNFLKDKGLTEIAIAGIMGNIQAESGFNPNNLQNSYNKKLGITDEEYVKQVDSGKITRSQFKSSAHGGFGLCQWTYHTRKAGLYDYAKKLGKSIGDEEAQLGFLWVELSGNYKGVLKLLNAATSVKEASDIFTTKFERPADQSTTALNTRAKYSQEYYDMFVADSENGGTNMERTRAAVVKQAQSWVGKNETDGSHKAIIDIYNGHKPLARGYAVKYTDAWCATFVSAVAIKLGYTDIIPTECGCQKMIDLLKGKGIWVENDAYTPAPGDIIFYDWQDSGSGDNTGYSDHVGIVETVASGKVTIIEGNYSNSVKRRTLNVNGKYIRGYGVPKYTATGNIETEDEKETETKPATPTVKVESAKSKNSSLAGTYEVTANGGLYLRTGAGKSKTAIKIMPKGTKVRCYGYYTTANGTKWLYVAVDGITGFCSSAYLQKC